MNSTSSTLAPRAHASLPGYTLVAHDTKHFGFAGAMPVDVYCKRGPITVEVRKLDRNQQAAWPDSIENWTMLRWSFKGESYVAIRVRA